MDDAQPQTGTASTDRRFVTLARVLLAVALVLTCVLAVVPHEPSILNRLVDKEQHALAFGVLALLAAIAYPQASLSRTGERLSLLGAVIEVVQAMPQVHRDCDIFDWLTDTLAIVVVLAIVAVIRRHAND